MKKTTAILFAAAMLVAQLAAAQMMGGNGGHMHGVNPGNGMGGGSGMGGTGMGIGMGTVMGQALTVGADGTVYLVRTTQSTGSTTVARQLTAIRPSGVVAWSAPIDTGMTRVKLSGDLVLVSNGGDMGMNGTMNGGGMNGGTTNDDTHGSLVAYSATAGSQQWKIDIDGFVAALEPFSGGTYVSVVKPNFASNGTGMNGGTVMSRTLLAVGPNGNVLWTVSLNQ